MFGVIKRYRFEIVAFLAGMSVMILEIVGARLVAPYFGSSIYVWTAMIGVILGALAVGYWYGGRLADTYNHATNMVVIFCGAAVLVLLTAFVERDVLTLIASAQLDLRLSSLLAALFLFGPPSLLIGMISPHLAKVRLHSLDKTGRTIGRLEAAGTTGSIIGTFLCGYFLLAYVGSRNITLSLVIVLVGASFLIDVRLFRAARILIALIALFAILTPQSVSAAILKDIDSSYSRYQVVRGYSDGRAVNYLITDSYSVQSASFVDDPHEPVLAYAKDFLRVGSALPGPQEVLVIGGGTHTFPTVLAASRTDVSIMVAEIDPALDQVARDYFGFKPNERLAVRYQDGRQYLRSTDKSFSVIFVDAYSSLTPPFHLATVEAVGLMAKRLETGGVVVANLIGSTEGKGYRMLQAMYDTYGSVFGHLSITPVNPDLPRDERQNYILAAGNNVPDVTRAQAALQTKNISFERKNTAFRDDFAPIEAYGY
jgi:spermidine synthase